MSLANFYIGEPVVSWELHICIFLAESRWVIPPRVKCREPFFMYLIQENRMVANADIANRYTILKEKIFNNRLDSVSGIVLECKSRELLQTP